MRIGPDRAMNRTGQTGGALRRKAGEGAESLCEVLAAGSRGTRKLTIIARGRGA